MFKILHLPQTLKFPPIMPADFWEHTAGISKLEELTSGPPQGAPCSTKHSKREIFKEKY